MRPEETLGRYPHRGPFQPWVAEDGKVHEPGAIRHRARQVVGHLLGHFQRQSRLSHTPGPDQRHQVGGDRGRTGLYAGVTGRCLLIDIAGLTSS